MDRRGLGVLVLAILALVVLVRPGVAGRTVSGIPVPTAPTPPPVVGDCLVALESVPTDVQTADSDLRITYPWARFGSCSGAIVGEVTAVDPTAHPLASATVDSFQSASSLCELDEVNYVGSVGPFDPATITTPGIGWQTQIGIASLTIGPSPHQRAGGASWTACVGATENGATYRGRIADALISGVLPPVFASCLVAFRTEQEQSCATPHTVEIIGTTEIFDSKQTLATVTKSCLGMAGRAMRTTDPTRGGRLKIGVYTLAEPSYTVLVPVTDGLLRLPDVAVSCVASVTDPARLDGTLIGLGDKPLPLA